MRKYTLSVIVLSLTLLLLLPNPITTADTPTSLVDATITAAYQNATSLHVTAAMLVHRIDNIFGTTYTQTDIDHLTNPDDLGAIKLRLHDSLTTQLQHTFPNALITPEGRPVYATPYFTDDLTITLTTQYFDTTITNITTLITGLLDSGTDITYHYTLTSTPGWNSTYLFTIPPALTLTTATTTRLSPDNRQVTWIANNTTGTTPAVPASLTLHATHPTTPPNQPERITLDLAIDTRTPATISLTANIQLHTLDLTAYHVLPAFTTGTTLPSDALRLLITDGLLTLDAIHTHTIQPLIDRLQPLLQNTTLNQPLTFTFTWDNTTTNPTPPFNTTHMDTTPPLTAQYHNPHIRLTIDNLTARAYFGLINAGANATLTPTSLNIDTKNTLLGLPTTVTLTLPQNITLNNQHTITWNQTTNTTGTLHSDLQPQPPYTTEKHTTTITIDISKMDLNLIGLFTGKTELTTTTTLTQHDALNVIRTPPEIHLPTTMTLPFLNADAYRLCTEEGLLTQNDQTTILDTQRTLFEQRLTTIYNGRTIKALTNTKTYTTSLQWNGDIATMDNLAPITIDAYADDDATLAASLSLSPATFTIAPLHFTLPHIANTTTTYRLIFPSGQTLAAVTTQGQPYAQGNTSDGRAYIEFLFNDTSTILTTPVTCTLAVSTFYVLALFLPLILVIVLIVILLIVILLIRKRRKRSPGLPKQRKTKPKKKGEEPEEPTGSEDAEDFYVPPPPPSSRRR